MVYEKYDWEVHKFGGTSVASAECFQRVADIIELQLSSDNKRIAVVVSAMGGKPKVTDLLLSTVNYAASREQEKVESVLNVISEKHFNCIDALPFSSESALTIKKCITSDILDLKDILKTVSLMKWKAEKLSELISGYGELWSTRILASLLSHRASQNEANLNHKYTYVDAKRVITIDDEGNKDAEICWDLSEKKLVEIYQGEMENFPQDDVCLHLVVTGYVASNRDGVATTLKRDGSDYSAAIIGKLLLSKSINIWTDVDGVLSADPRRVPTAFTIPDVSFDEAMELAYFGAKVIHPKTMQPAISANPKIPIYIKNTFRPKNAGTRIYTSSTTHTDRDRCVCGFATVEDIALLNVEGAGMIGVRGVANRLFGSLENADINVVLISQASSEHTITFATHISHAFKAKEAIEETFSREIQRNHISQVDVVTPCAIIAAVGDGMKFTSGVAGRFFSALGDAGINVLAIAQGSSEKNISAVVSTDNSTRALRAVHAAFRLSKTFVRIGIVGMNDIGMSLLDLLYRQHSKLCATYGIDLHVCAVIPSPESKTIVSLCNKDNENDSITPQDYQSALSSEKKINSVDVAHSITGGLGNFSDSVQSELSAHTVIFDCTASEVVGTFHPKWLKANIHVITANNTALSGPKFLQSEINEAEQKNGNQSAQYLREVTVGGALPVLTTLKNLLHSGDKIRRIDGIFSTALSYIMHRVAPPPNLKDSLVFDEKITNGVSSTPGFALGAIKEECTFSEAVEEAKMLGLMEEDPIKDLSNEYTARILMVVANELGMASAHSVEKIKMESDTLLQTEVLENGNLDQLMRQRVENARKKGCVPRHVSSIDVKTGIIDIKVIDVPYHHLFAINSPSCVCVRYFTDHHMSFPLVIKGPAAGVESTASGLLAELLRLMQSKIGVGGGKLSRTESSALIL